MREGNRSNKKVFENNFRKAKLFKAAKYFDRYS